MSEWKRERLLASDFRGLPHFAGDVDGLVGVAEDDPGRDGDDVEDASFLLAVFAAGRGVCDRHGRPRQGLQLIVQAWLVALDGEHEVRATSGEVVGVRTLSMPCIYGEHGLADGADLVDELR